MWIKIRNKLIDWSAKLCAAIFVILIAAVTVLVPVTIIFGCVKLIFMMLGV